MAALHLVKRGRDSFGIRTGNPWCFTRGNPWGNAGGFFAPEIPSPKGPEKIFSGGGIPMLPLVKNRVDRGMSTLPLVNPWGKGGNHYPF